MPNALFFLVIYICYCFTLWFPPGLSWCPRPGTRWSWDLPAHCYSYIKWREASCTAGVQLRHETNVNLYILGSQLRILIKMKSGDPDPLMWIRNLIVAGRMRSGSRSYKNRQKCIKNCVSDADSEGSRLFSQSGSEL